MTLIKCESCGNIINILDINIATISNEEIEMTICPVCKQGNSFIGVTFKDIIKQQNMNILERANEITFLRNEEKERQYGPFKEGMLKASIIATELCDKEITAKDITKCLIALKLSRESYNHKYDNLLDILSYTAILNELNDEKI
jgi:hypothetical protein